MRLSNGGILMLATELAYRELLIKEHVDGLSTNEEIANAKK